MKKNLSYYVNPGFWDLVLRLAPCVSKNGQAGANRISFDEFRILLWRYHGKASLKDCVKLLDIKVSHQRIQQKEARALKIIKQLFITGYRIN